MRDAAGQFLEIGDMVVWFDVGYGQCKVGIVKKINKKTATLLFHADFYQPILFRRLIKIRPSFLTEEMDRVMKAYKEKP